MKKKLQKIRQHFRWRANEWVLGHLPLLAGLRGWLTIQDAFGAPGDALLAATVCRVIKSVYPHVKINLVTRWPNLVYLDPSIDSLNAPETFFTLRFWYLETVVRKESKMNVLLETLSKVGIYNYEYKAKVFLSHDEIKAAEQMLGEVKRAAKPLLAICSLSKEAVKNWPGRNWQKLIEQLRDDYQIVHLGDAREPMLEGARRFAGGLSMRESMALLSCCDAFIGPDSFLMHAANGLDIPSVIIFGGSRPSACLGYRENVNLFVSMPCGPCWLHDSQGDVCPHDIDCMARISVADVEMGIRSVCIRVAPEMSLMSSPR